VLHKGHERVATVFEPSASTNFSTKELQAMRGGMAVMVTAGTKTQKKFEKNADKFQE